MKIYLLDKKLKKASVSEKMLISEYGQIWGSKISKRLEQLKVATSLEEVRNLPGNFHELIENRKGQWACDLDQPYRLIFKPEEKPIPINEHGQYIWSEIKSIEILEIVNYHKEK